MGAIETIVAATDFSRPASAAVRRAAMLARTADARLELVHVLPSDPMIPATWKAIRGMLEFEPARVGDDARDRLRQMAGRIEAEHALPVETHLAEGRAYAEIVARADAIEADLVVVGAHGEHFVLDLFAGTTTQRVQRHSAVPVLVVRLAPFSGYEHVLLATDFSPASEMAARVALGFFPDAAFHVLHVFEPPFERRLGLHGVVLENYRRQVDDQVRRELEGFVRETGLEGRAASIEVRHGYAPTRIKERAAELGADLIALGTHGKSWLTTGFLGSVSEHVAAESFLDVLLVRPSV